MIHSTNHRKSIFQVFFLLFALPCGCGHGCGQRKRRGVHQEDGTTTKNPPPNPLEWSQTWTQMWKQRRLFPQTKSCWKKSKRQREQRALKELERAKNHKNYKMMIFTDQKLNKTFQAERSSSCFLKEGFLFQLCTGPSPPRESHFLKAYIQDLLYLNYPVASGPPSNCMKTFFQETPPTPSSIACLIPVILLPVNQ